MLFPRQTLIFDNDDEATLEIYLQENTASIDITDGNRTADFELKSPAELRQVAAALTATANAWEERSKRLKRPPPSPAATAAPGARSAT